MTNEKFTKRPFLLGLATLIAFGVCALATSTYAQDETADQPAAATATEAPAAEAPATEAPAAEAPATEAPAAEAPATGAPAVEAPATEAPAAEAPAEEPLAIDLATEETAATETPATEEAKATEASAETPATEEAAPAETKQSSGASAAWLNVTLFVAIFVLAILFSLWCVRKFKASENSFGYFLMFFCFVGGLFVTYAGIKNHSVNLGVDLSGGSILVYKVSPADPSATSATISNHDMDLLKEAIGKRINPSGVREISIQEMGDNSEVKITIPEADDVEVARLEKVINSTGALKFRILANTSSSDPDEKAAIALARQPENADLDKIELSDLQGDAVIGATWIPLDPTQGEIAGYGGVVARPSHYKPNATDTEESTPTTDILVLDLDKAYVVNGDHVELVEEGYGEMGEPLVRFTMTSKGSRQMEALTDRYKTTASSQGRQLGVVLNDRLFNAPTIQNTISDRGQITFGRSLSQADRERIKGEVRDLIAVMHAGVLPAKLSEEPTSKMVTGPSLGADTIRKGKNAILWGGVIVLLFMIAYYGFGGLVATFAVLMNLALIMTAMITMHAAFTLPGLAGLVLTVGMAVDANVLIFERIREELRAGSSLRMAVRNGYQRAFSAIFDSNITTILTAWILWLVGSEQIKSFAITLGLGVLFSMFTATYICRIIFMSCEKAGWLKDTCVNPIFPGLKPFGRPNWDFFSVAKKTYKISVAIIIIGLIAAVVRGKGIFDVDFVGGVEIQVVFTEPVEIEDLRKLPDLPDLSVSELELKADRFGNPVQPGSCYAISASCPKELDDKYGAGASEEFRKEFEELLKKEFATKLPRYSLNYTVGEPQKVTPKGQSTEETQTTVSLDVAPSLGLEVVEDFCKKAVTEIDELKNADEDALRFTVVHPGDEEANETTLVSDKWNVVFVTENAELVGKIAENMKTQVDNEIPFEASSTIGSSVAGTARTQGALAILGSLLCIIAYLWFRFRHAVYGLSAVVGLVHDVAFTFGLIALSYWLASFLGFLGVTQFKIGLSTVAAFLTLIGYSLNDTIVLFDRMREVRGKSELVTKELINTATNQTFSRTLLTSITTGFSVLVLYVFGGAGIHTFAFAMLVGVIVGTYSSIFICAPFLYWVLNRNTKK